MTVPTLISALSTTAASNNPAASESVFPELDDHIRFIYAGLASIYANTSTNGWTSPYSTAASPTFTGVASFPDGSVGAPSITNTGDTNTGVWFPAADTIAMSTAGAEVIRLDSSGNIGIGTSSPSAKLHSAATSPTRGIIHITSATGSTGAQLQLTQSGVDDWTIGQPAGASAFAFWSGRNTGSDGTERIRIDSSGNLGIGTTSPTAVLDVSADTMRLRTAKTPASAGATGNAGDICWDASYVYVCVATNTWKRSALSTW